MDRKQLADYFRHIMDLETLIRNQEQIQKEFLKITVPEVSEPRVQTISCPPSPPKEPEIKALVKPTLLSHLLVAALSFLSIPIFHLFYLFVFWITGMGTDGLTILTLISSAVLIVFSYVLFIGMYKTAKTDYEEACIENIKIKEEHQKKEDEYKAALASYKKKKARADKKYREACKEAEEIKKGLQQYVSHAKAEANRLAQPIRDLRKSLDALYNKNIIYPKYRNMVAVCTIYEYLESGRCSELEGPAGAYNLYESELRQNLIISNLEEVNNNLQIIQKNQFMLYTKLNSINTHMAEIHGYVKKLNSTAQKMADDISAIRCTTQDIAHDVHQTAISSFITAQCSIITAQNTTAIKYLSAN